MAAYYNENDPKMAAWLRELIKAGEIPAGDVDERSITEISPHEITAYTQQHFFAGVGGWAIALRLAGWPDGRPVRTGSCPCQPFSNSGIGLGEEDPRHLWPFFRDAITFGQPTVTFGEQVASAAGRLWLSRVRADLEGLGYEVGLADLPAACVGSPQIRQRLWWVAHPLRERGRCRSARRQDAGHAGQPGQARRERERERETPLVWLGHAHSQRPQGWWEREHRGDQRPFRPASLGSWATYAVVECADGKARRFEPGSFPLAHGVPARVGRLRGYGNAIVPLLAAEFIQATEESLT